MVAPTNRLGLKLQDTGSNLNVWGDVLNTDVITLLDEASGVAIITVSSAVDVVLTNTFYVSNQARRSVLQVNGTPGATFNVIVPTFDKPWFVHNRTAFDLTVKMSSGAGAVVRAGQRAMVYSDGVDCFTDDPTLDRIKAPAAHVSLNGKKTVDLAPGTAPTDGVNYQQWLDLKAYAQGLSNSGILAPGTVDGTFLSWSAALQWHEASIPPLVPGTKTTVSGSFNAGTMAVNVDAGTGANQVVARDAGGHIANLVGTWAVKTAAYTAVTGDQIIGNTAGGAFTVKLPATPAIDDQVVIARSGASNLTIDRNGSSIAGKAENHVLDSNNALVTLVCTAATTWSAIPGMMK